MGALPRPLPHAAGGVSAVLSFALLAWALVYVGAVAVASIRAWRRSKGEAVRSKRRVLLVRPCAGSEPGLVGRLSSAAGADSVVLAVASRADSALPAALEACTRLSSTGAEAEVVVTGADAPNRKAHQLAVVLERARANDFDAVAVLDSDVDARDVDVRELAAGLDERVAAVWRAPVHRGPGTTLGDRATAAVLSASMHSFPLLAGIDGGGMVGKCFVVDRRALARVGGFADLTRALAEDMELGRRLRAAGLDVVCAAGVVDTAGSGRTLRAAVERFARWAVAIRAQRPVHLASYPLFFFPALLVPVLALAVEDRLVGAVAAALVTGARVALALVADRAAGRRSGLGSLLVDAAIADVVLACAAARAVARRGFRWRGIALAVGEGGQLFEVIDPPSPGVSGGAPREARS